MLAPAFDVADLEAGALEIGDGPAEIVEFAAWKDVARQRLELRPLLAGAGSVTPARTGDGVMQVESARLQKALHGLEVGLEIGKADVLEHADRDDLVEQAFALEKRVVALLERDPVGKSAPLRLLARERDLLLRQRYADHLRAECSAAWQASEPQPLPMSSKVSPGRSLSLRQVMSSFCCCAVSRLSLQS